eukprot:7388309-Prymnesium_polylepis.2
MVGEGAAISRHARPEAIALERHAYAMRGRLQAFRVEQRSRRRVEAANARHLGAVLLERTLLHRVPRREEGVRRRDDERRGRAHGDLIPLLHERLQQSRPGAADRVRVDPTDRRVGGRNVLQRPEPERVAARRGEHCIAALPWLRLE